MQQYEQIADKIKEADGILIGASNGLSIAEGYNIFANDERFRSHFSDFQRKYGIRSLIQGSFGEFGTENEMWSYYSRMAYYYMYHTQSSPLIQNLYALVKDKPHFVVTSNTDDHLAMAGFERKSIFEIEGNMKDMQCARGCHDKVYSNREAVLTMMKHEQGMEIPSEYLPKCPVCGGAMQIHNSSNKLSASTHTCIILSRYNLTYLSGSSIASAFNAQSDPGVVFKFFSASQQSMRSIYPTRV